MSRERWALVTPYCWWCDYPLKLKSGNCFHNCPAFKRYRKSFGQKKYRKLIKNRIKEYLNEV